MNATWNVSLEGHSPKDWKREAKAEDTPAPVDAGKQAWGDVFVGPESAFWCLVICLQDKKQMVMKVAAAETSCPWTVTTMG